MYFSKKITKKDWHYPQSKASNSPSLIYRSRILIVLWVSVVEGGARSRVTLKNEAKLNKIEHQAVSKSTKRETKWSTAIYQGK